MTVTTYPAPRPSRCEPPPISRILKGEWTKLRTLPSTWRTAVFAFVVSIGAGAILVDLPGQRVGHHDA